MKNLTTMNDKEKRNHLSSIMSRIKNNSNYIIEDVTPKGYGVEEN